MLMAEGRGQLFGPLLCQLLGTGFRARVTNARALLASVLAM
jgi:hypothetical protein